MKYINMAKNGRIVETVDEFETDTECIEMLKEYRKSDKSHEFYISNRCTEDWANR